MASLNQVSIELQVTGERQATKALKDFANAGKQVGSSVGQLGRKISSIEGEWRSLTAANRRNVLDAKALESAKRKLARQLSDLTGQTEREAKATLTSIRNSEARAIADKQAALAAQELAKQKKLQQAIDQREIQSYNQLRSVIDQSYAARMRLKQAADTLRAAERQGLITRQEAIEQLRLYRDAAQQAAAGGGFMGRNISRAGVLTQQAGYQVGDFIVQVQSGTNAFVAFGQQATQIAGTLTLLGGKWILIGSVLGITIPLLTAIGAAFMRTRQAANNAARGLNTVEDALNNLKKAYDEAENSAGSFQDLVDNFNAEKIAQGYTMLGERAASAFDASLLDRALMSLRGFGPDSVEMKVIEQNLQDAFGMAGQSTGDVFGAGFLQSVQESIEANDIRAIEDIITSLDAFANRNPLGEQFIQDLIKIVDLMKGYTDEVREAAIKMEDAYDAGKKLEGLNIELGVDAAASAAQLLAERLGVSLFAAERMVGLATGRGVSGPEGAVNQMRAQFTNGLRTESIVSQMTFNAGGANRTGGRSGGTASARPTITEDEYLAQLRQEVDQKRRLSTLSEEQRSIEERVIQLQEQAQAKQLTISNERLRFFAMEEQRIADQMHLQDVFSSNIETAMMSLVQGTQSVEDAFKGMLRNIILEIYKQQVVTPIAQGAGSFLSSLFFANGGAFNRGNVIPFANGGVVGSPTTFPMANGNTGLMGEAGPEAIMPLKRGKDGKLGVAADSGGAVTVNNYFTVQANGDDSVKRIVRQQIPQIAEATKAAVVDSKRRGGSYGRAFG